MISDDTVRVWWTILQSDRRKSLPRSAVNPDHLSGPAPVLPQVPLFVPPSSPLRLLKLLHSFNRISVFNEDFRASDEETYKSLGISSLNEELNCTSRLASMGDAGMLRKPSTKLGEARWTKSLLSRSRTCLRLSQSQVNLLRNPTVSFSESMWIIRTDSCTTVVLK